MIVGKPCGFSDLGLGVFLLVIMLALFVFAVVLQFEKALRHRLVLAALEHFNSVAPRFPTAAKKCRKSSFLGASVSLVYTRARGGILADDDNANANFFDL